MTTQDPAALIADLKRLTDPATDSESIETKDAVRWIDEAVAALEALSSSAPTGLSPDVVLAAIDEMLAPWTLHKDAQVGAMKVKLKRLRRQVEQYKAPADLQPPRGPIEGLTDAESEAYWAALHDDVPAAPVDVEAVRANTIDEVLGFIEYMWPGFEDWKFLRKHFTKSLAARPLTAEEVTERLEAQGIDFAGALARTMLRAGLTVYAATDKKEQEV